MYAGKNHESLSIVAFYDRRHAVRIVAENLAPAEKLGAILPIDIERSAGGERDLNGFLVDTLELIGIEVKPDTRGEIQADEFKGIHKEAVEISFPSGTPLDI